MYREVVSGTAPPLFLPLAAHPLRWQLLDELATGDLRVRELVAALGVPQNLVSYHLRLLRGAGLVTKSRSSFDARDSYYHLDLDRCADLLAATGPALHPALLFHGPVPPAAAPGGSRRLRILFACTGNGARSPIAEALLRHRTRGAVEVTSAGSHPRERIHPSVVKVLGEGYGIDITGQETRHLDTMTGRRFDYVVTLCDKVREACPDFPDHPRHIHWSIPDPAPTGAEDEATEAAIRRAAQEIDTRIGHLLHLLAASDRGKVEA